jgi:hypothetical protein
MKNNLWITTINVCVDILERRDFNKKLPATHGGIFYDYVNNIYPIEFSNEEKANVWNEVIKEYKEKNKSYPEIFKFNLNENKTCINLYKSELVRLFFKNNKELLNEFKPKQDVNETD